MLTSIKIYCTFFLKWNYNVTSELPWIHILYHGLTSSSHASVTFHFYLSFIPPHMQLILSISIPFKIRVFKIKKKKRKKENAAIIKFSCDGAGVETKDTLPQQTVFQRPTKNRGKVSLPIPRGADSLFLAQ